MDEVVSGIGMSLMTTLFTRTNFRVCACVCMYVMEKYRKWESPICKERFYSCIKSDT